MDKYNAVKAIQALDPADFCSKPGITIEDLRKEIATKIKTQTEYLNSSIEEAERIGLTVNLACAGHRVRVTAITRSEVRRY